MPGQSISFDITAKDDASRSFRSVGDAALEASGKMDIAAASAKLWTDTSIKQGRAADTATSAMRTHADAAKLLADAEAVLAGKATTTTKLLADQGTALENTGKKAANAAGPSGLGALTGATGGTGAMGYLIGAGVALAPVVASLGLGLTALGVAAYGIAKPIETAAQKTGGLRANLHLLTPEQQQVAKSLLDMEGAFGKFEKSLQPTVLTDFNDAIRLSEHLMTEVQPLAKVTGGFLGTVLNDLDKEFRDSQWQGFFTFLAGPGNQDVQLLGDSLTHVLNILPSLVESFQTFDHIGLQTLDDTAKLADGLNKIAPSPQNLSHLGTFGHYLSDAQQILTPGGALNKGLEVGNSLLNELFGSSNHAAQAAHNASAQFVDIAKAVTAIDTAESKALSTQTAYAGDLVTTANDAHTLEQALRKSHDEIGLHTAAQRASFGDANTYITDLGNTASAAYSSGKGVDASITAIRKGLPVLDQAKTKNQAYWQEVKTLIGWLDKLRLEKAIHESIFVSGSGTFTVKAGTSLGLPGGSAGGPFAAGGLVSGGIPGKDSVLIRAMPGEAVVPTRLTPAVAPFLRAHGVPGFAAGGLVPSYSGSVRGLPPWGTANLDATVRIDEHSLARATVAGIRSAAAQSSPGFGITPNGPLQAYARKLLAAYGWSNQWAQFNDVVMRESGWNVHAYNPSGAYGLPQALPGSKMASAGADWMNDGFTQLRWMMGYIKSTYGDPAGAWNSELTRGWYDNGGWLHPGVTVAVNNTGQSERVLPPGKGTHSGPLFGDVNIYNGTDAALVMQKLSFAVTAASFGS